MKLLNTTLIGLSFFVACSVNCQNVWIQKTNFGGSARYAANGFAINGKGYILTGDNGSGYVNDVWAYDTGLNSWTQKNNFGGSARLGVASTSLNGFGYVMGGRDGSGYLAEVWKYDPSLDSWTQKTSCPGGGRYYCCAVANPVNGFIYFGCGDNGGANYLSDFWKYDPVNDTWTSLPAFPGGQRSYLTGFCLNGELYFGTGNNNDHTDDASSDWWKYDPAGNSWTQVASVPGYPRRDAPAFVIGNYGYVCGGINGTYGGLSDVYQYDPVGNTWTPVASYGAGNTYASVGFAIGNNGFVGTGFNQSNVSSTQFWEFTQPACTEWTQKTNFGGSARYAANGFAINGKGYILTGDNGSGYVNDVWAYDTGLNSWTQKNNFGGTARLGVASTSLNGFGYVMGGRDGSGYLAEVWKYDPSLDSWTQKTSCPGGGRYYCCAVANPANGFIYFGCGDNGGTNYLSDFWKYDPVNDTWTSLPAFPGGQRSYLTGFCLNGELYFGTGNNNDHTDDASSDWWKYDPAGNSWTQVASVPGYPRRDAPAFVIGNYGYVCGGINGTYGGLSDVYQYDPVGNTWTPVASYGGGNTYASVGFGIGNYGFVGTGFDSNSAISTQYWRYSSCSQEDVTGTGDLTTLSNQPLIYPNPSPGMLHFNFNTSIDSKGTLVISDVVGRIMESSEISISRDNSLTVNETKLSNGIYFYKYVVNGSIAASGKFVIQK